MSHKLQYLLADPQLRQQMGQAGRQRVLQDYNIDRLCDRLVGIYQETVAQSD
ncbi:MAG: glycosyltransferase [Cyanobacteria bacterium J06631_6]